MNERKRQVLLTAQRLFVEKGFSATSVQDILDESKISKGTFYNYFSSKNECLMAILEHVQEVASLRQRELLIGQDVSNKHVLAEQISIRLQVNREQNLIPLFEAIFHSGDQELRDFVKEHHLDELLWLTRRITEVYGEDAAPYAFDCTVMLLGMLQHMTQIRIFGSKESVDNSESVHFVMRRIDSIVSDMIRTKDTLLGEDVFLNLKASMDQKTYTKQELLEQLTGFYGRLEINSPSGKQYVQFLIEELQSEHPRVFLIETISRSFIESFTGTSDESEAQEIASRLWKHVDTIEKGL